jgi:hypothetical protein
MASGFNLQAENLSAPAAMRAKDAKYDASHRSTGNFIFFSSGFAVIRMEGIRFISQNVERSPMESIFSAKIMTGDTERNLGPSTDFSLAENIPAGSGLIFFLDRRNPRGRSAASSVSGFRLFLG